MPDMRGNNLARRQFIAWARPNLKARGLMAWEAWAFDRACQLVREGEIDGVFTRVEGQFGYKLTTTASAPIVPDDLMAHGKRCR